MDRNPDTFLHLLPQTLYALSCARDADETPWLLVYTDVCKNTLFGGLGVVIFDRATGL